MESNASPLFSLSIDPITKSQLTVAAKWARFLAIVGMVFLILGLIATIAISTLYRGVIRNVDAGFGDNFNLYNRMSLNMIISSVIMLIVTFFPLLFLLRFANGIIRAVAANDQQQLNTSFQNLKIFFRYLGIMVLIILIIYALIFVLAILGASFYSKM